MSHAEDEEQPEETVDTKEIKMKITKRQLKRIIREEYARLKRRGLINESPMTPSIERQLEMFEQQLVQTCGEDYQYGELTDALENDMYEGDGIYSCEQVLLMCDDNRLAAKIKKFCRDCLAQSSSYDRY